MQLWMDTEQYGIYIIRSSSFTNTPVDRSKSQDATMLLPQAGL